MIGGIHTCQVFQEGQQIILQMGINKSPRLDEISPKTVRSPTLERTNKNLNLHKPIFMKHGPNTSKEHNYSKGVYKSNLKRVGSQISLINRNIQKKNIFSPNKRTKVKSRAKTGQGMHDPNIGLLMENSISPCEEYYQTSKISPSSSAANSFSAKVIPSIKSSQSCRNKTEEILNVGIGLQVNKLCAVKESEEEQMTETFTRLKKKYTQPQQKEISKNNINEKKRKILSNNQQRNASNEDKSISPDGVNFKQSRSKSNVKKHLTMNQNLDLNLGFHKFNSLKTNHTNSKIKINSNLSKNNNVVNLPSI